MRILSTLLVLTSIVTLSGCATIVSGESQQIALRTTPVSNASCTARNALGQYNLPATPGVVTVQRSSSELIVACEKEGYTGKTTSNADIEAMLFGNILVGGIPGLIIDAATGSFHSYDNEIDVAMTPIPSSMQTPESSNTPENSYSTPYQRPAEDMQKQREITPLIPRTRAEEEELKNRPTKPQNWQPHSSEKL